MRGSASSAEGRVASAASVSGTRSFVTAPQKATASQARQTSRRPFHFPLARRLVLLDPATGDLDELPRASPRKPRQPEHQAKVLPTQSAVGQDLAVELIAGGVGEVGGSWGAARGAGHACGMISGRSRRGEKRAQKKTSGGVAPIHLRKCATAREPYE